MNILWIIVIGFVAGVIAHFLAPGPNNPQGFILTTVIGIVGAFLAHLYRPSCWLVPARSGRGHHRRRGRRRGRAVRLASAGVTRGYPRPRLPPLVVALAAGSAAQRPIERRCTIARGVRRSTTTARGAPIRPVTVTRFTSLRWPMRRTTPRASSGVISIKDATISICSLRSSVRPCAATTASSIVGGSRLTRRRPSLVSHMSFILHLGFETNYRLFAALQQGNCAMHARQIHTPLTRSVNRPRSRERATDGGRKRSGPARSRIRKKPARDLVRGANGLPKRSCSTKKIQSEASRSKSVPAYR
jgi:uncharacterized membrane protein YeaQ/YmgE (transglycosylase-associated protein family)